MVSCTRNAESWRIWCLWHILRQKLEQCCRIFPAISGVRAVHLSLIEFMLLMQCYMLQLNCWATYLLQVNSRHQKEHCRFSKTKNFCAFMLIYVDFFWIQNEIEILKAENDRLKAETGNTGKPARPSSESSSSTSSSSSRQSLGLSLNNLNITESVTSGKHILSTCMNL